MSKQDKRRPRRQIVSFTPDDYIIQLEQVGHEAWRLTVHDGIDVQEAISYTNPDEAQTAFIGAIRSYTEVLAAYTLAPLPKKPSEIVSIEEEAV